ncbi:MAG: DUF481 domain-containing protein [Erythrobacter sp.]|jgi:putative salt-induced outer membrane protein
MQLKIRMRLVLAALLGGVVAPSPAHAELPEGARAIIEAAIASADARKVATAIELARSAYPGEEEAIAAIEKAWQGEQARRAELSRAEDERKIRDAGLLELWKGEGELGGFVSSGNTSTSGLAASLKLERKGIRWEHAIIARVDYQRESGTTSREQYLASYEPRWQFNSSLFAYGLTQYERNRFQGFDGRYAISGGLGYRVVDRDALSLAIKAGPALRIVDYSEGESETRIAGLAGLDLDWRVFDRLSLTQDASVVAETGGAATLLFDSANTTLNLVSGLDFSLTDRLRARLAYRVDFDSNPPTGNVSTDTLTRATLIYGF